MLPDLSRLGAVPGIVPGHGVPQPGEEGAFKHFFLLWRGQPKVLGVSFKLFFSFFWGQPKWETDSCSVSPDGDVKVVVTSATFFWSMNKRRSKNREKQTGFATGTL